MRRIDLFILGCTLVGPGFASAQDKAALPEGAVARLGIQRLRVPGSVFAAAFTPDQRTLAVSFHEGSDATPNVALFSVATGLQHKRLDIAGSRILAMARTKPLVAVMTIKGAETWFEIWDLSTQKRLKQWVFPKAHSHVVMAMSPDGSQVAAAGRSARATDKAVIHRWEASTGKALPSLDPKALFVSSLSFSPDGTKLFSIQQGMDPEDESRIKPNGVIAWNAKTGEKLNVRHYEGAPQTGFNEENVVLSPDGAKIARSRRNEGIDVFDFDPASKNVVSIMVPQVNFAFTPDSKRLVILSNRQPIRVWDIAANRELRSFGSEAWDHFGPPTFSPDGKLFAAIQSDQGSTAISLWELDTGLPVRFPTGHPGPVNGLAYAPDGKRLATFSMDSIAVFEPKTGEELRRWTAHKAFVEQIAFSPDGKLLASGSVDGTVALWDPQTGKERRRFTTPHSVRSIAFARDGTSVLAVCDDGSLQKCDIQTGVMKRTYQSNLKMAFPALSPSGQYLAFLQGERINRVDSEYGAMLHWVNAAAGRTLPAIDLRRHRNSDAKFENTVAWAFAFSADGKLLATSDSIQTWSIRMILSDHSVRVWETATGHEIMRLSDNPVGTHLLALSPDGRILAQGVGARRKWGHLSEAHSLILRDISAAQSESMREIPAAVSEVYDPSLPPQTREQVAKRFPPIAGHQGSITSLTFSPDSKFLATGGSDQIVYVWRVEHF